MAQTLTATSGLVSAEGARVPLVGVSARAEIRDYACRLVLSQRFRNDEAQPIEAVYKFPLDEGTARLRLRGRDRRPRASSATSRSARRRSRPTTRPSPRATAPTSSTRSARTSSPPASATCLRARRPCCASPPSPSCRSRATPSASRCPPRSPRATPPRRTSKGVGETEAERVSPPYALAVPYGLTLEVDVETTRARALGRVAHRTRSSVTIENGRATVRLSEREAALDRDVVLKITLAETHQPRALVERDARRAGLRAPLVPPAARGAAGPGRGRLPRRPLGLDAGHLDRRGSQRAPARAAEPAPGLLLQHRRLRRRGSSRSSRRAAPYDDASLAEATKHVTAARGRPRAAPRSCPRSSTCSDAERRPGLPRQVFVLTDGEVSNTDAVIALGRSTPGTPASSPSASAPARATTW